MRNIRPIAMIAFSALLGLVAVALAANWLKNQEASDTLQVVVANRDLPMGTRLQADMLETVRWPKSAPIVSPLTAIEQANERVINVQILRGEPLLKNKLAAVGEIGGLSSVLREGRRAVTVKVNEVMGVAGFALPGNYVDLMVNTPDGQDRPVSKIVIERIKVLAVAQDVVSNENKPRVVNAVTLEVTPWQAEKIDLARSVGTLSLVLRNQVDTDSVISEGARKSDLLPEPVLAFLDSPVNKQKPSARSNAAAPSGQTWPAHVQKSASAPVQTEVIRGLTRTAE
jgi:pilus assembly protein CpaB